MRILAIDTATTACSVAIWRDGDIAASRHEAMERGQSEALMPMILDVQAEAGEQIADLDLIAVTNGPGAFTGLRIGLAAARALALAADVPCFGVTTTEAIAAAIPAEEALAGPILVAIGSKRADLYVQTFDTNRRPTDGPRAVNPDVLAGIYRGIVAPDSPLTVVGDASAAVVQILKAVGLDCRLSSGAGVPDAAVVAGLAASRWQPGIKTEPPRPIYLRPPDAVLPRDGGRLRP